MKAIRGVHDILPADTPAWRLVEETAARLFDAYGYQELRPPVIERTELFQRGLGEVTDVVQKEMYTFTDRSGESLTLRPEATASVLRAYIEHGLYTAPKPVKLYTIGPMFRHERPQAGRYRQFHQINAEALGEASPGLDGEVMVMLVDLFEQLDVMSRLRLEVNTLGDEACRPAYRARLVAYLRQHAGALCEDCRDRTERNPLRVLDCKNPACQPVLDAAPRLQDELCADCAAHFAAVREYLDAAGIKYAVNPRLVRGFDYYVRTTFEVVTSQLGAQNAVAGGGRYDGLVQALGGPPDPGIGFAIGMERLVMLLDRPPERPRPDVVFVPLGRAALLELAPAIRALRRAGIRVETGDPERKLRAQLDKAGRLQARYAVILGDDELARRAATLRDLTSGEQTALPLEDLAEGLRRRIRGER
ncbi:MAG TPA: histidine--tRNA ligase [Candidatus Binatia bacterium]|nr:histidine--tRNA ligase [Candidatus Binatia bacterium]